MLNLVPFARSRREMTNGNRELELVCQLLKLDLPEAHAVPVAATAVGRDHQTLGFGVALPPHRPPPPDGVDGKGSRVVVGADTDPSDIGVDVVDPIWDCPAQLWIDEVMHVDEFGLTLGAPLATIVLAKWPTTVGQTSCPFLPSSLA